MSAKDWLKALLFIALFYTVAPYLLDGINRIFSTSQVLINYTKSVSGRVTGSYVNRQHHFFYLDGDTKKLYDFNAFVPVSAYPQADNLSQEEINNLVLGAYLQNGDQVNKLPNSTTLAVNRGNTTTRWRCSPNLVGE